MIKNVWLKNDNFGIQRDNICPVNVLKFLYNSRFKEWSQILFEW